MKGQTGVAETNARVALQQANAAATSAQISEKAFDASQRAWVGPTNAHINGKPTRGNPIEITIDYQNTGREPAQNFNWNPPDWFVPKAQDVAIETSKSRHDCMAQSSPRSGQVVYPTSGMGNKYNLTQKLEGMQVTDDIMSGKDAIFIQGCFVYTTLRKARHSYFCFFYKEGQTDANRLGICEVGQDAD